MTRSDSTGVESHELDEDSEVAALLYKVSEPRVDGTFERRSDDWSFSDDCARDGLVENWVLYGAELDGRFPDCGEQAHMAVGTSVDEARFARGNRGVLILAVGIGGLLLSLTPGVLIGFPMAIVAWAMAGSELRSIEAGYVDPRGRGFVVAGKVCGILAVGLVLFFVLAMLVGLAVFWFSGP